MPCLSLKPPSHRRRGATAVLVRHKPQWHRHNRRGSAVVPSLIAVAPRKIVKTADLLPPSHRRRGATAVVVRHKPQWHRHDRRVSVVVPVLIAVAPRKNVKSRTFAVARRKLWTCSKLPQCHRGLGQSAVGSPRHRHYRRGTAMAAMVPYKDRSGTCITAVHPPCNREKSRLATLRRSCGVSSAVMAVHWPRSAAANTAVMPPMIAVVPPSNSSCNPMRSPCPQWPRCGSAAPRRRKMCDG